MVQANATAAQSKAAIASGLIIPAIQSRFVTGVFLFESSAAARLAMAPTELLVAEM